MGARKIRVKDDWMQAKWRPAMAWLYGLVCGFDFILFPIFWSLLQASIGNPITQWSPLTLQGGGFFHVAMGAVIGIAAYGRTQEKVTEMKSGNTTENNS